MGRTLRVETIGNATLYCGDCREVLPALRADAVVTDPPYGIEFEYESYEDTLDNWHQLITDVIPVCRLISRFTVLPCCAIGRLGWWYENMSPDWLISWYQAGTPARQSKIGFNTWQALVCFGRPERAMHDYFYTTDSPNVAGHPCPKPKGFNMWLCSRAAPRGGTIIDPFMGSGTCGVACADLGRKFIGIEIEPKYFDIACERIERAQAQPRLFA